MAYPKNKKKHAESLLSSQNLQNSVGVWSGRDSSMSSAFNVDAVSSHFRKNKYTTNQSDLIAPLGNTLNKSSFKFHNKSMLQQSGNVDAESILFANPSLPHSSIVPHVFTQDVEANAESVRKASVLRTVNVIPGTKNKKWYILACSIFCFAATFHCLLSISALESLIEDHYDMSNAVFGSLGTSSFGCAMVAAMIVPYFVNKFDLYKIVIVAQVFAVIGQALTIVSHTNIGSSKLIAYIILYFGRGFVGFAIGIDSVSIQALIGLWFRQSPKKALAFALVNNSIQIGIATALYILIPIEEATDSIVWALSFGLIWATCSIHSAIYMLYIERQLNKKMTLDDRRAVKTDAQLCQGIKLINESPNNWIIWGIIIIIFSGKCVVDTFSNESQSAFVTIYAFPDWVANIAISVNGIVGLSSGAILGYIVGKIGQLSRTLMFATFLMTLGLFILGANDNTGFFNVFGDVSKKGANSPVPWIGVIFYSYGLSLFFISGYSSLFTVIPIEVMSVASSIVAMFTYGTSMLGTAAFGYIADDSNFSWSFLFLCAICLFAFIWACIVHVNDGGKERLLRKK